MELYLNATFRVVCILSCCPLLQSSSFFYFSEWQTWLANC